MTVVDTGTACLYQVDIILDRTGPLKMALPAEEVEGSKDKSS